ncbi:MAG: efflux RND transporter periplasmic adaptor subunit [Candidatus Firestonebacteria bacterium]
MKKIIIGLIILLLILAVIFIITKTFKNNSPQYKTVKAEKGDITNTISATGILNPTVLVQVGSQVSGTVKHIYVDFNSIVKKGDMLLQIDPAIFDAQLLQAEANVEKTSVDLTDAKRNLDKNKILFEKNLISKNEIDILESRYNFALASKKQTDAAYKLAKINLQNTTILSPIDGIIVLRNIDEGQTVVASFQSPTLFTIANDLRKMQINTNVDEADIEKVKIGQKVNFTVDTYPDEEFNAVVSQIRLSPNTVQNIVTYDVILEVFNSKLKLKPGMTANVNIIIAHKQNVLKLPASVLRFTPSETISRLQKKGFLEFGHY